MGKRKKRRKPTRREKIEKAKRLKVGSGEAEKLSETTPLNYPIQATPEPEILCLDCAFWKVLDWACSCKDSPYYSKEVDPDQGCEFGTQISKAAND